MKVAADLMTNEPICVSQNHDFRKMIEMLLENHLTTIAVVDEEKRPIAVFTEEGLMRAFVSHRYKKINWKVDSVAHYLEHAIEPPLVNSNDPLPEVFSQMMTSPIHRVYVVREKSKVLCGVISPHDLLAFLFGQQKQSHRMRESLVSVKKEILELKSQVNNLESMVEKYEQLFENSPYMIHSSDRDGKIVFANAMLHRTLSYGPKELLSKTIFDLYPSNQHENAREGLKHIVQTGYYQKTYTAMIDREHKLHFVDLASSSVHDDAGNFVCTVTISRVLENHELEKVLDSQEYFTTVSRKRP